MTHHLPPVSPGIRFLTTAQSERVNAMFKRSRRHPCLTCSGRGVFRWYTEGRNPDSVSEFECPCDDQFRLHRRYLHSGITDAYQRLGWDDFFDLNADALDWVLEYTDNVEGYLRSGMGAIIWGDKGTGKTLLSTMLAKTLVSQGVDCYSSTFHGMLEALSAGWRDKDDRDWFNRRVRNADVLLVDDVGREKNKGTGSLGENALEEVLRHRTASAAPTIITTNDSPDRMRTEYGSHTMSLLSEAALEFRFRGRDSRARVQERSRFEIRSKIIRPVMES